MRTLKISATSPSHCFLNVHVLTAQTYWRHGAPVWLICGRVHETTRSGRRDVCENLARIWPKVQPLTPICGYLLVLDLAVNSTCTAWPAGRPMRAWETPKYACAVTYRGTFVIQLIQFSPSWPRGRQLRRRWLR